MLGLKIEELEDFKKKSEATKKITQYGLKTQVSRELNQFMYHIGAMKSNIAGAKT